MWWRNRYYRNSVAIILFLIVVILLRELEVFKPVKTIIGTLFYPLLISGFLYYLFKPFVRLLRRPKWMNDLAAILTLYTFFGAALYGLYRAFWKPLQEQFSKISEELPSKLKQSTKEAEKAIEENDMGMLSVQNLQQKAANGLNDVVQSLGDDLMQIASTLTGATTVLFVVPFVLFYLLKDDHKLIPFLLRYVPKKHESKGRKLLKRMDDTLSAYVVGQVTVAIVDGLLMYVSYLILGMPYALLLGLFVTLTAVVPFFGPIIGVLPALVVALTQQPILVVYVLVALVIVQQLEGNLVAPLVLGKRLKVHPLTIILLLIVAAALYGFVGMLIAIPTYAVVKVIVVTMYRLYQLREHAQ
ncbi:hypothetical protein N781_17295 [Pontibacillus halophilus JSM 076056 = DSM 19796]|uniref:AI-2E family transporter n=1 Tax=Pontibacillus halophilus JSM 076056 = DSM 19796 TaxID=1385510 RepID=A0A0A5GGW2_9BACI|nr:AI-2E family transporter [Pontibacillus halophilus]KGX92471.1 hypothetical protein N781_17295 [Pontibacillus halophilus JSM 076056 = DSM 19796]